MKNDNIEKASLLLKTVVKRMQKEYMNAAKNGTISEQEIIEDMALMKEWSPSKYDVGDVRKRNGQPYHCVISHDSRVNVDWIPGLASAVWYIYHSKSPESALPFVQPTGEHDSYIYPECMIWPENSKNIYRPKESAGKVSRPPNELPDAWDLISGG